MRIEHSALNRPRWACVLLLALAVLQVGPEAEAQMEMRRRRASEDGVSGTHAAVELRASEMIESGLALLAARQDDRGLKVLQQVPRMFPDTQGELRAHVILGKHYSDTGAYDDAVAHFEKVVARAEGEQRAEVLFRLGACRYEQGDIDQSLVSLRRVTVEHRWSPFANDAYYYIGLCHFKQKRWRKADEALTMVGLSLPEGGNAESLAEAGQRLYVRIQDKDLAVMMAQGRTPGIQARTPSGDTETLRVEKISRRSSDYVGSLPTAAGAPVPGDDVIQFRGSETVTLEYIDENTQDGAVATTRVSHVKLVSTAAGGFCDGAYRHYVNGVFGDQPAFIKVKDLDRDESLNPDHLTVRIVSRFKEDKDPQDTETEPEWVIRDGRDLVLTETDASSGVFTGVVWPVTDATNVTTLLSGDPAATTIRVNEHDELVMTYQDDVSLHGTDPVVMEEAVPVVLGRVPDVESIEYKASDLILQARKRMVEARIFLKWAQIFNDVGLVHKAIEKSSEGLRRTDDVLHIASVVDLEREVMEESYKARWELLIVQNRLKEAVDVCRTLTERYPDSRLADQAFLNIALARLQGGDANEAIPLFQGVLALRDANPDVQAEAQYNIGVAQELLAQAAAEQSGRPVNLAAAIASYQRTAEAFPNSHFAGEALRKHVQYYIVTEDYERALELLERVVRDYPDKPWLDDMILKWGIASYRLGDPVEARKKFLQVVEEYPGTSASVKAKQFLASLDGK